MMALTETCLKMQKNSQSKTLLIVDDDKALREMLALSLTTAGYDIEKAATGKQAMDVLQQKPVDIVLLDMGMPPHQYSPEEGVKVLEAIQKQMDSHCKVIVLTGQNPEKTAYLAIKHGAFDFLSKPVSNSVLLQSIERAQLFLNNSQKLKETEGVQKFELDLKLGQGVKSARNAVEKKLVQQILNDTQFNIHEAARRLGLKRENVYYLMNKYGVERPEENA